MGEHTNDIAQELALLHTLRGASFSRHVEAIARRSEFHPVENERNIFSTGNEHDQEFPY